MELITFKEIDKYVEHFAVEKTNRYGKIEELYNPIVNIDKLKDIDKASDHIINYMREKKHIAIVTDYDADGVNSAATLYKAFTSPKILGYPKELVSVIVNKRKHGNGFSDYLVKKIFDLHQNKKIDLIVTADHGTPNEKVYVNFKRAGIETIVTDHHMIESGHPISAIAFVNNQREDSYYYTDVSGCAIAFIVMLKTKKILSPDLTDSELLSCFEEVIPYVAISTITDVMSMLNPFNQWVITTGINIINSQKYQRWNIIKNMLKLNGSINFQNIGYTIGPYINTANRIDAEDLAFELLTAERNEDIQKTAMLLNDLNDQRKSEQRNLIKNLEADINNNPYEYSLVIKIKTSLTINGTIASISGEKVQKPCVCFIDSDKDIIKGSSRGIVDGLNLMNIFKFIKDQDPNIIVEAGGHKGAAGCSIYKDKLNEFQKLFDIGAKIELENIPKKEIIALELPSNKISIGTIHSIYYAGAYGKDYPAPVVRTYLKIDRVIRFKESAIISGVTATGITLSGWYKYTKDITYDNISDRLLNWITKVELGIGYPDGISKCNFFEIQPMKKI